MNGVSIGEYHGLRVGSALLSIVSGCIIIGVSKDCDADAVGGIFLGAGGLGNFRVHPIAPPLAPEQPADSLRREGTLGQMERSKSRMGTFAEAGAAAAEGSQEYGPSTDAPDILGRRKPKLSEVDLP
ncbi:kinocilin isoform X1 [Silurus asotus]|uniref:Kinocilin isoform X1 n=1 Tax=Silurus asotus TaxID=30991 RepID=A0AAD5A3R1_SILAS|nr:kinocilin isoform X1 [Silurus asotus]